MAKLYIVGNVRRQLNSLPLRSGDVNALFEETHVAGAEQLTGLLPEDSLLFGLLELVVHRSVGARIDLVQCGFKRSRRFCMLRLLKAVGQVQTV